MAFAIRGNEWRDRFSAAKQLRGSCLAAADCPNGQVNYVPNVNDMDQRLLAGGDDVRALFASRIADPRYVSTITITP